MNVILYHQLARIEETHWWFKYRRCLVEDFLSKLKFPVVSNALDIGCGTAGNIVLLKKYCDRVSGMDCSEEALELAKKKAPYCDFIKGDANNISELFAPATFNLVTIFNVLYHKSILSESNVLAQIYTILQPGGYIIVTEPSFDMLTTNHDIKAMGKRRYRLSSFKGMITSSGFEVVGSTYFNFVSFLPVLVISCIERFWRIGEKPRGQDGEVKELMLPNNFINKALLGLMDVERIIIRVLGTLPLGVTLLCIARKP